MEEQTSKGLVLWLAALILLVGWGASKAGAYPEGAEGATPEAVASLPQAQQQQPQPQGPTQQPGETVIIPKKQAPPPPVQPKTPLKINPNTVYTLSTTANLVNVNVGVEDDNGDPIGRLGKDNFKVYDDGTQQPITNFNAVKAPITVCMLVEFSNEYWPLLYQALESSYQFLNFMRPNDWIAVVSFDLRPHILTDFTHSRSQVASALHELVFPGFSEDNLYDALAFTIDRMKDIQGRKAILAIVSGYDTMSKLDYDQMLKIAKASTTPIYPVSILEWLAVRMPNGYNINYWQARNGLTYIAKYSGGQAYFPRFEGELPGIYRQIGEQLRDQYSIGFAPSDPGSNGKYHKLKVELVDAQGNPLRIVNQKGKTVKFKLVYRDGYYAAQH
ncbi:MAG: VWA domain-containing protein [Terriglobia bacterium]